MSPVVRTQPDWSDAVVGPMETFQTAPDENAC